MPTEPTASPIPAVFTRINVDGVTAGCEGGPIGGDVSGTFTHETWILHCPAGMDIKSFLARLDSQVTRLGATKIGEGSIVSNSPANSGEVEYRAYYQFDDASLTTYTTTLPSAAGLTLVIAIDQVRP